MEKSSGGSRDEPSGLEAQNQNSLPAEAEDRSLEVASQRTSILDLPAEMLLNIANFMPGACHALLGLTCQGARKFFIEQSTNLSRLEKKRLLLILQKEYPGSFICQIDLVIRFDDFCCDVPHDPSHVVSYYPSDNTSIRTLQRRFDDRKAVAHLRACLPVPSISRPYFILCYAHVNRVILQHRLGPKFGMPLENLSLSIEVSPFRWRTGNIFRVELAFRIAEGKLYMHGRYTIKGKDLLSTLTSDRFPIDVCPHIHLEHNRHPGDHRARFVRKPIRIPPPAGCQEGNSCPCTSIGAYNPRWYIEALSSTRSSKFMSEVSSCQHCPTDLKLSFDDAGGRENFIVDFWRCIGNGIYAEDDVDWVLGSLNELNKTGQAIRIPPGNFLVGGEPKRNFELEEPKKNFEVEEEMNELGKATANATI